MNFSTTWFLSLVLAAAQAARNASMYLPCHKVPLSNKPPPLIFSSKPSAMIRVLSDFYSTTWQVRDQPPRWNEGH